jgi:hypothetical protein
VDLAVEDFFKPGVEFAVLGNGTVQDDGLVAVGRQDLWVVPYEHHQQDQGHQGAGQPEGFNAQAGDQPEGQRREVVGHLVMGQFGGPEPDDGQDPEEAQPQAQPGG